MQRNLPEICRLFFIQGQAGCVADPNLDVFEDRATDSAPMPLAALSGGPASMFLPSKPSAT